MPAIAPFWADADFAERQGQFVHQHHHILKLYLLSLQPVVHGFAAQVHIGIGFYQQQQFAPVLYFSHIGVTVGRKFNAGLSSQAIGYFKADVVAGFRIFRTDIAKADY